MDKKKIVTVKILNAFDENNKGGNPAGVVLNADSLSNGNKQEIAKKTGLSETAFISKSPKADYKLDFFTPNRQIAHCGHATIAAFSYLKQIGHLHKSDSSKETIDGIRHITFKGELAFMEQTAPKYFDLKNLEDPIMQSLRLKNEQLLSNSPIKLINTGNSFVIVPVKNSQVLKNLNPDFDQITKISNELDLIGYYVFTTDTGDINLDATARMFGPRYGIWEESGTGMAAGPLACYLYDVLKLKKKGLRIQQGKFMKNPSQSLILVDLHIVNDKIKSLMAGGKGILSGELDIEIDI